MEPSTSLKPMTYSALVHENDLPEVEARVLRTNRQAKKIGVPLVSFRLTGKEERRAKKREFIPGQGWVPTKFDRFVEVEVKGEQPKMPGGWRLTAVVDYRGSVPQVSLVPGQELHLDPRGYGPKCDHCGTSRQRAEVFVLANDANEGKQVGRNCLGDFLGLSVNDPAVALRLFARSTELLGFNEEERMSGGFRRPTTFDLEEVMFLSGAIVNLQGWVSIARCEIVGAPPTSQRIREYIDPPMFGSDWGSRKAAEEYRAWRAEVNTQIEVNGAALKAEVTTAREWARTRKPMSEFDREMADAAASDSLAFKFIGRAAYILPAFRKEQERLNVAKSKAERFANSQHIGTVKERGEMTLTLIDKKLLDGHFGTTVLATFDDGQGNQVKWFASECLPEDWKIGETKTVKATVKSHTEFKGTKQTQITRATVIKPKEESK